MGAMVMKNKTIDKLAKVLLASGLLGGLAEPGQTADVWVPNLEVQFSKIAHHGDPFGFNLGVARNPDWCRHYQGLARYNAVDGTPFFYLTRSGGWTGGHCTVYGDCGNVSCPGELVVVRLGSRDRDGERMRSNKLQRGVDFDNTAPDPNDVAAASFSFDGAPGWPRYRHPGGVQIVNDVMAIAFEKEEDAEVEHAVGFYRLTDPLHPVLLNRFWMHPGLLLPISETPTLGMVGMTQEPSSGKYLLVFAVTADSSYLAFYETTSANLADPDLGMQPLDLWHKRELGDGEGDWREWQSLNFLRQTDGSLYLACSGANASGFGTEDWIRLYRVIRNGNEFTLQSVTGRHLQSGEPNLGDCGAAGGFYVSPTGQLIFYLSEHDNDGPNDSIFMGEFRNYDVREPATVDACGGWVEFYEDEDGWADSSPDRSVIWDLVDAQKDDWQDLSLQSWDDEFDSIRWNLPPGMEVTLYKDVGFTGDSMVLSGQGVYGRLDAFGFGDCISSVQATAGHLVEVLVSKNCVVTPGGSCANTVADGLERLDRCSSKSHFLSVAPGAYPEALVIGQEVTLRTASTGMVTIGSP